MGKIWAYKLKTLLLRMHQQMLLFEDAIRHYLNISGVRRKKRNLSLLVALTSFQARTRWLRPTLASLMRQSIKPDKIILYLHRNSVADLPPSVLAMRKRGLEITILDGADLLAYKKIIPSLKTYPDALIVTADDDLMYERTWLAKLYHAYQREPHYLHCHRAHRIKRKKNGQLKQFLDWDLTSPGYQGAGSDLVATNGAGTLFRSSLLSPEVFNQRVFLQDAPYADDLWIYAMARKQRTLVKKIAAHSTPLLEVHINASTPLGQLSSLSKKNFIESKQNDRQLNAVLQRYDLFDAVFEHPSVAQRS